jgi:hypothetical protein
MHGAMANVREVDASTIGRCGPRAPVDFLDTGQKVHIIGTDPNDSVNEGGPPGYSDGYLRRPVENGGG